MFTCILFGIIAYVLLTNKIKINPVPTTISNAGDLIFKFVNLSHIIYDNNRHNKCLEKNY